MARPLDPNKWEERKCETCSKLLSLRKSDKRRFCSKTCALSWQHKFGERKMGFDPQRGAYSYWLEKLGKEEADRKQLEFLRKVSDSGKRRTLKRTEASRERCIIRNKSLRGKNFQEIYGIEKANEIKQKLSVARRGERNPAFGKVYARGGHSVKGWYKNKFFRSLGEYSYMKFLESTGVLLNNVVCEPVKIPYEFNGVKRTYTPDFKLPDNMLIEIKPASYSEIQKEGTILAIKFAAAHGFAIQNGMTFKMLRNGIDFPKIEFDDAQRDIDVKWDEKSIKRWRNRNKQNEQNY